MNLHENLNSMMLQFIEDCDDCVAVMPSAVAAATFARLATAKLDPHIEYATLEHLKGMARKVLSKRYDEAGPENPAYDAQGELFKGGFQQRYPVPRAGGGEPQYKRFEDLTPAEMTAIGRRYHRCGAAWIEHGDKMLAAAQMRAAGQAA